MTATAAVGTVTVTATPLTLAELLAVARGAHVELGPAAIASIEGSRTVVERALLADDPVYGLNTGLGHGKDHRVSADHLRRYQELMVMGHAGAIGSPLATEVVRAAMLARVNGMARGGSGATPAAAATLVAMLNAGVHPVVPRVGSVGAADLMHMAAIAEVVIGRGRAELGGEMFDGGTALAKAGIEPLRMEPKDGLALVSANGVAIGHGAAVVDRATRAAELADLAAALSIETVRANLSIIDPIVGVAKPIPGLVNSCAHLRAILAGSDLWEPGAPKSIQDALSFRVAPQVHGALRELIAFAAQAVETELNAIADNPLVSQADGRMVHSGNFHPILLALAFDALRPAVVHVAQISERRMNHVMRLLWGDPGVWEERMERADDDVRGLVLYSAAATVAELKGLGGPASFDCPPLDFDVEDHATTAPLTVEKTERALDMLEDVMAIELVLAADALRLAVLPRLGAGTAAAFDAFTRLLAAQPKGGTSAELHGAVRQLLHGPLLAEVHAAAGWPED